jgi:hypothetical protein
MCRHLLMLLSVSFLDMLPPKAVRIYPDIDSFIFQSDVFFAQDAVAPDVSTRTQMGKHLIGRPLIGDGSHLQSGVEPSEALAEELITFAKGKLSSFKVPRWIEFPALLT